MRTQLLYFNSLSVPMKIVTRATLGTRAVGCRPLPYSISTWVKRSGHKAANSPPTNAEFKNEWSYTTSPYTCIHGVQRDSFTFTFIISNVRHSKKSRPVSDRIKVRTQQISVFLHWRDSASLRRRTTCFGVMTRAFRVSRWQWLWPPEDCVTTPTHVGAFARNDIHWWTYCWLSNNKISAILTLLTISNLQGV